MIKVLIAEDNVQISVNLSNVINHTKEVHGVSIVNEGQNVYPAIKRFKPHVVVLDLKLPGEDGISILKKIEADPELKELKILVYSGEQSYIKQLVDFSCVERFFNKTQQYEEVGMEIKRIAKMFEEKNIENKIYDILTKKIGFAPHHIGTKFIKECVEYSIKYNEDKLNVLYDKVSMGKSQSSTSIKGDINRAVKEMWKYSNHEKVRKLLRLGEKEIASPKNVIPMVKYYATK